jgi:hypothetical protein
MLQSLKDAAKKLPYPILLRTIYAYYAVTRYSRFERIRRAAGLPLLNELDLATVKKSDTLFILGGGPSINQITAERWQAIARHDSVGVNFWLYHPFVPTMYVTESISRNESSEAGCRLILEAMQRRAEDYRDAVKIITDLYEPGEQTVSSLDPEFCHNLYAAYDIPLPARDEAEFEAGIRYLQRKGLFHVSNRMRALFKYGLSLSLLISLGLRMGYKTIVLCGIDLKSHEYFYNDEELFPETAGLHFHPTNVTQHAANVRQPWMLPQQQVVSEMKRLLLEPAGVRLYVENPSSALWPMLEQAPESVF